MWDKLSSYLFCEYNPCQAQEIHLTLKRFYKEKKQLVGNFNENNHLYCWHKNGSALPGHYYKPNKPKIAHLDSDQKIFYWPRFFKILQEKTKDSLQAFTFWNTIRKKVQLGLFLPRRCWSIVIHVKKGTYIT